MGIIIPALQVGKSRHREVECLLAALWQGMVEQGFIGICVYVNSKPLLL